MRVVLFIIRAGKEAAKDDLFAMAGQLTYKMLLAFFPFLIFLISLMGFINMDGQLWLNEMRYILPGGAVGILDVFYDEVIKTRSVGVLSTSLLVSLYNASSGFKVVVRCVNLTYGYKNCRNFLVTQFISIILVFMFALSLTSMLLMMIFNDKISAFVLRLVPEAELVKGIFTVLGFIASTGILLITTMMIYKLSNCRKTRLSHVLPGAVVTVAMWIISSKVFNIYVNNFSRLSYIYGSIAGVFILIMWLNLISTSLLLGSEINSMLDVRADMPIAPG
jgi:membrane protein